MDGGAWVGHPANDLGSETVSLRDTPPPPGEVRRLFRFGLGLAALARERLGAILAAEGDAQGTVPLVEDSSPENTVSATDMALGLALGAADVGQRARPALRARWAKLAASARRLSAPLVRACGLIGWLPGVPRRAAHLRAWRAREGRRLARWAATGRHERAESRAVARAALTALRETVLARIAESPDVKHVIREQSEGIAVTAVGQLRERSAHIDDLAEGAIGRLLGRGRARRSR